MVKTPINGGFLVAIEGIDGSGKSTIASLLTQYCGERGIGCCLSKEPTGLGSGLLLRQSAQNGRLSLETEIDFFLADRAEHIERAIAPALAQNYVVILDRYYWSTAAYQGARGADPNSIMLQNKSFAPEPDLILLLDIPAEIGQTRIRQRGDKPNEFEEVSYLAKAREIFLSQASSSEKCVVLNASTSLRELHKKAQVIFQEFALTKISNSKVSSEDKTTSKKDFLG
jgi:dTMP kinase